MARSAITTLFFALLIPAAVAAEGPHQSLPEAARAGDLDALKALVARGADLEACDAGGATALHLAAAGGRLDLVRSLIEAGADVKAAGPIGNTALHYAAQEGYAEIAAVLVKAGADPGAISRYGTSPESLARGWGHRDVLAVLSPAAPAPTPTTPAQWLLAGIAGLLALVFVPVLGRNAAQVLARVPSAPVGR